MSFLLMSYQTQVQKNDPSALALRSFIISELIRSKPKECYNYLTKCVPQMYEIQFLGWNFKSLKNSNIQSGIKVSLTDLI